MVITRTLIDLMVIRLKSGTVAWFMRLDFKVDYIISHCCSTECQNIIAPNGEFAPDSLTDFFDIVRKKCEFQKWYFGHYHMDLTVSEKEVLLYDVILPIGDALEDKAYVPGRPRYSRGDDVDFWWSSGTDRVRLCGNIEIVDRYGSFERPDEPSYDIYAAYEGK